MSQADQDKTEQPTPHRLEEARKRGEVAKSAEIAALTVLVVFAAIVGLTAATVASAFVSVGSRLIVVAGQAPKPDGAFLAWLGNVAAPLWQALTPLALGLVIAAVLGNVVQFGPLLSTHPLKPDFKRMNPAQALKRIFSMRTLWELAKTLLKLSLLTAICAVFVWKAPALIESVSASAPRRLGDLAHGAFVKTSLCVLLVLAAAALADGLFARREYMKKMRMSRRELKEEVKRRDGDPTVKSRQRQQIRELLKKVRALAKVGSADVVVTNPTHVAVALRYRPGETPAPVVLAKGADLLSARIRQLAARHRVPVIRAPALARALYRECAIDGMVPAQRYSDLAPVYREIWARAQGAPR
ncbi:MAG: EscU/YscU/HrcU family type III secretion system export apparatus switch protein [Lysobacteraceae bacterium]|nr:MAG: EscU/YscU/HrcU family type III secretion system export apparatus switch protein [Xanthomonadaceae bacterium]